MLFYLLWIHFYFNQDSTVKWSDFISRIPKLYFIVFENKNSIANTDTSLHVLLVLLIHVMVVQMIMASALNSHSAWDTWTVCAVVCRCVAVGVMLGNEGNSSHIPRTDKYSLTAWLVCTQGWPWFCNNSGWLWLWVSVPWCFLTISDGQNPLQAVLDLCNSNKLSYDICCV